MTTINTVYMLYYIFNTIKETQQQLNSFFNPDVGVYSLLPRTLDREYNKNLTILFADRNNLSQYCFLLGFQGIKVIE